jgi:hypothetical protein
MHMYCNSVKRVWYECKVVSPAIPVETLVLQAFPEHGTYKLLNIRFKVGSTVPCHVKRVKDRFRTGSRFPEFWLARINASFEIWAISNLRSCLISDFVETWKLSKIERNLNCLLLRLAGTTFGTSTIFGIDTTGGVIPNAVLVSRAVLTPPAVPRRKFLEIRISDLGHGR